MLNRLLKKKIISVFNNIEYGEIHVTFPDHTSHLFKGSQPGIAAELSLKEWSVITHLFLKGDVGFAEDYREGHWTSTDLTTLLQLSIQNKKAISPCYHANKIIVICFNVVRFFNRNTWRYFKCIIFDWSMFDYPRFKNYS